MAFVVNERGAVRHVPDEWAEGLLAEGFRMAAPAEVARWYKAQGLEVPGGQDDHGEPDHAAQKARRRSRRRKPDVER